MPGAPSSFLLLPPPSHLNLYLHEVLPSLDLASRRCSGAAGIETLNYADFMTSSLNMAKSRLLSFGPTSCKGPRNRTEGKRNQATKKCFT